MRLLQRRHCSVVYGLTLLLRPVLDDGGRVSILDESVVQGLPTWPAYVSSLLCEGRYICFIVTSSLAVSAFRPHVTTYMPTLVATVLSPSESL